MAFLEGIAGYVKRKDSKKRRCKTESRQRYSTNGLMTNLGLTEIVQRPQGHSDETVECRNRPQTLISLRLLHSSKTKKVSN